MAPTKDALLRALCFYDVIEYPPTLPELSVCADRGEGGAALLSEMDRVMTLKRGRVSLDGRESLIQMHESYERLFSRKIRRARWVTRWLVRLGAVRFVALCNTTAWAHASDQGDLDFFIVVRANALWQTRGLAALPFKLLGLRPTSTVIRDAVCLSFFVDETALDLSRLALAGDDVYLRHWFLSLLPLYDDGIGTRLWEENALLRARHPWARRWTLSPDLGIKRPWLRLPWMRVLEKMACQLQTRFLGTEIRTRMNKSTDVVVNEHVLKFHVQDGREGIRARYQERCRAYGLAP